MTKKLLLILLIFPFLLSPGEAYLNQDSPELAEASQLSQRVVKLYGEKKYDEAMPLAKRALELREKALAQDHPLVVSALNNLALLNMAKGKFADAESLYERSLAAQEKTHGTDSPKVADALENLAWARYARAKCGPDIFAHASIEAARKWRFTSTTLEGRSVKVIGTITFNFVL